jgi:predicted nucleic acid-binding Zn ribbon protein
MDKNGNKTKESVPIGSVLKNILKNLRHDSDEDLTQVWQLWDEVVGIAIAENAQPAAFKGKLLLVNVISSTWIHQLQFLKKDIIEKLNIALGQDLIKDIKFKIGPV